MLLKISKIVSIIVIIYTIIVMILTTYYYTELNSNILNILLITLFIVWMLYNAFIIYVASKIIHKNKNKTNTDEIN